MSVVMRETLVRTERHAEALRRVRDACRKLDSSGVTAQVIGSLATGEFGSASDVDILITRCPQHLKYALEGMVEDCLGELRFDVVYLDEVPVARRGGILKEAVDARNLR